MTLGRTSRQFVNNHLSSDFGVIRLCAVLTAVDSQG
jgi:hypothetical protein